MGELKLLTYQLCRTCNTSKPFSAFYQRHDRSGQLMVYCKECRRACRLKSRLRFDYSMTVEEYNTMFSNQEGCCAICDKHQGEMKTRLQVDHCHTTGRVRGLLCGSCNKALGLFKDNSEVLEIASKYLKG